MSDIIVFDLLVGRKIVCVAELETQRSLTFLLLCELKIHDPQQRHLF